MRFLLPILTLVAAEIEQEWRLDNTNSVLSGPMSPQMVKEIAEIAFEFLKTKHRPRILLKRTKKPSFMDYDDTMSKQSLAVDAPAPMVMLNHDATPAVGSTSTTLLPIIRRKPLPRTSSSQGVNFRRGMSRSRKQTGTKDARHISGYSPGYDRRPSRSAGDRRSSGRKKSRPRRLHADLIRNLPTNSKKADVAVNISSSEWIGKI